MKAAVTILWLLLGLYYWWAHNEWQTNCCGMEEVIEVSTDTPSDTLVVVGDDLDDGADELKAPIMFYPGEREALKGRGFNELVDSLEDALDEGEVLEVYGGYYEDEADSLSSGLGLARARSVRTLLSDRIDESRIQILSTAYSGSIMEARQPFEAISFLIPTPEPAIKKIHDRTLIYFGYNSNQRVEDEEIEMYLLDVVARVLESGETISLTGHTDSFGHAEYNYRLGQLRANIIADYLIQKGVPTSRISVESKGESTPIAPNNTEEGRSKNRRVELIINNQNS